MSTVIERLSRFKSKFSWSGGSKDAIFTLAQRHYFNTQIRFPKGKGFSASQDYIDNFNMFITEIDLPNLTIRGGESIQIQNPGGNWKSPGNTPITPDDTTFKITFIDTEKSIFENFFFPWMKYIVSPTDSGSMNPFPRANISVWLTASDGKSNTNEYIIEGVYPIFIQTPSLRQAPITDLPTRTVNFDFNKITLDQVEPRPTSMLDTIVNYL